MEHELVNYYKMSSKSTTIAGPVWRDQPDRRIVARLAPPHGRLSAGERETRRPPPRSVGGAACSDGPLAPSTINPPLLARSLVRVVGDFNAASGLSDNDDDQLTRGGCSAVAEKGDSQSQADLVRILAQF